MEQIKKFLRSRGFTLALLACLVAAAAAGVWAVRTVRDELKKSYDDLTTPQEEPAPEPQLTLDPQEDDVWHQPVTDAAESAANVPKPASSASSSGAQSGSGLVHEPSALQGAVLACQQFSCACLHAARLGQRLEQPTAAMSWCTAAPLATGAPTTVWTTPVRRMRRCVLPPPVR